MSMKSKKPNEESSVDFEFPYHDIINGLVFNTMLAQRIVVEHLLKGLPLEEVRHIELNQQFSWLSYFNIEGENRHLVEAPHGMAPLANSSLRRKRSIPSELINVFQLQLSGKPHRRILNIDENAKEFSPFIQTQATRISSLIVESFSEIADEILNATKVDVHQAVHIKSPLSIVYDFLTVPDSQGTRAYALVACRNYLFKSFELAPDLDGSARSYGFSIRDIDESLSHIWTSFRKRYLSLGDDKLPPGKQGRVDGLVRHHLAMRKILDIRFRSSELCLDYLKTGELIPKFPMVDRDRADALGFSKGVYKFEFSKSNRLDTLPESGEIVNELWGLPIPLRGANIVFKGGLKFSGRQGLVVAIHGGPGAGKTSFALAFAAHIAPLNISTWFLTAEEIKNDLINRVTGLVSDQVARLSFFPKNIRDFIQITKYDLPVDGKFGRLDDIERGLDLLTESLQPSQKDSTELDADHFRIQSPCNAVIILDGLHDLFASRGENSDSSTGERDSKILRLYQLVEKLRNLQALVILTTGTAWAGDSTLDYLVDVAVRLSHESTDEYGKKPDRRFILTKARHQLCAGGTHGLQIGGTKGVRLSPQINYQLEGLSYWRPRLPDPNVVLTGLRRARSFKSLGELAKILGSTNLLNDRKSQLYINSDHSVSVSQGSHVFLNGMGSGGKAALAIKLAISPAFQATPSSLELNPILGQPRVLVVSFLYPTDYYAHIVANLRRLQTFEYRQFAKLSKQAPRIEVIHLYPGYLRPHDLFNRIEWELNSAELNADPYTCVVIDGIHNVFLQFPEIEKYSLFWPQLYSALRSRKVTTISTHTTLALPYHDWQGTDSKVDDNRSEPLRHALVQKTDFQFEIDPFPSSIFAPDSSVLAEMGEEFSPLSDLFVVKTVSAIGQKIPRGYLLWSRESMEFYDYPQQRVVLAEKGRNESE